MRVAFYAPLKPPAHPTPSGDRRIARLLLEALRRRGHDVRVVSDFRSYEGAGDRAKQDEIERRGAREAERLLRTKLKRWRPEAWFTYHLYQKAPDWLGPPIAKRLAIPYLVAEAAYAPRRARGRWDRGLRAVKDALQQADTVLMLNPNDEECVAPLLRSGAGRSHEIDPILAMPEFAVWRRRARSRPGAAEPILPFLDAQALLGSIEQREAARAAMAREHRIPADRPWLLAVAMMREGDKLASYRVLAAALSRLKRPAWRLLVAGDGRARRDVRRAFAPVKDRVHWLGALPEARLRRVYFASDVFVWPAINEAIGMAILEAQAAGLPVVAGKVGAIPAIVAHRATGLLVPEGDTAAFRAAVFKALKLSPAARERMAGLARVKAATFHDLLGAADHLDRVLRAAVARETKRRR
jgi:glycosyltransferase involved in cell wall biosynthesis